MLKFLKRTILAPFALAVFFLFKYLNSFNQISLLLAVVSWLTVGLIYFGIWVRQNHLKKLNLSTSSANPRVDQFGQTFDTVLDESGEFRRDLNFNNVDLKLPKISMRLALLRGVFLLGVGNGAIYGLSVLHQTIFPAELPYAVWFVAFPFFNLMMIYSFYIYLSQRKSSAK